MSYETIIVEERGPVLWLTLNRPERLNAITTTMGDELADVFAALKSDRRTRVVVMRGAGRAFSAGLDIKAVGDGLSVRKEKNGIERLPELIRDMRECPQPVVALLSGAASGGGFAMALAADIRIADPTARMNAPFVKLGLSGCELGVSYFLPRYVGLSTAIELMYTGRFLDAQRAYQLGLVSKVVPTEQLETEAEALLQDLLAVQPFALRKTKEIVRQTMAMHDLEGVMTIEEHTQAWCMRGPDFEEGLRAFIEKRAPVFSSAV